jgi:hypothetical protein
MDSHSSSVTDASPGDRATCYSTLEVATHSGGLVYSRCCLLITLTSQVWVPSEFNRQSFAASGVKFRKLHTLVQVCLSVCVLGGWGGGAVLLHRNPLVVISVG